jgi:hypothetical protein
MLPRPVKSSALNQLVRKAVAAAWSQDSLPNVRPVLPGAKLRTHQLHAFTATTSDEGSYIAMKGKEHNVDFIEGGLGLVGPSHLIWLTKPKELVFRNSETENDTR